MGLVLLCCHSYKWLPSEAFRSPLILIFALFRTKILKSSVYTYFFMALCYSTFFSFSWSVVRSSATKEASPPYAFFFN